MPALTTSAVHRFSTLGLILLLIALGSVSAPAPVEAQQRIGYVDSEEVLEQLPAYANAQQELDRIADEMEAEIRELDQEVDRMFDEYQARELLYTQEERERRRREIVEAEEDVERLRQQYFGPEGEFFQRQEERLRPLQEQVLQAVEVVADENGYDYVFDRSGDFLFLYAAPEYNLTRDVLRELGIDVEELRDNRSR